MRLYSRIRIKPDPNEIERPCRCQRTIDELEHYESNRKLWRLECLNLALLILLSVALLYVLFGRS